MKPSYLVVTLVLLVILCFPPVTTAQQILQGTYDTGFQVMNLDPNHTANIQIFYYNQDGSLAAAPTDAIPAGGMETYYPLTAVSVGFNGSVLITSDRGIRAVTNILSNNGTIAASYNGFTSGGDISLPLLMYKNNGYNTWYNVQNIGNQQTTIDVLYSDGMNFYDRCTLAPGAACTLIQSTEGHNPGWVGSATIYADQPLAVSVMEVSTNILFSYDGFTGGSAKVSIPLVNANNSGYVTGIQIMNMGQSNTTNVTLAYTPSAAGSPCEETLSIQPGQSETFALYAFGEEDYTPSDCVAGETFIGSAEVTVNTANVPLVAIVNQLNLGGNKGAAYEAFDPADGTDTVVFPLIMDRNGGFYTGFSVLNVGDAYTSIQCTFSDASYTIGPISLAPGEALTDIQNGKIRDGYVGSATCRASTGGMIVGVVNQLNDSGDMLDGLLVYNGFNQTTTIFTQTGLPFVSRGQ